MPDLDVSCGLDLLGCRSRSSVSLRHTPLPSLRVRSSSTARLFPRKGRLVPPGRHQRRRSGPRDIPRTHRGTSHWSLLQMFGLERSRPTGECKRERNRERGVVDDAFCTLFLLLQSHPNLQAASLSQAPCASNLPCRPRTSSLKRPRASRLGFFPGLSQATPSPSRVGRCLCCQCAGLPGSTCPFLPSPHTQPLASGDTVRSFRPTAK
jgi:hypothetical protein